MIRRRLPQPRTWRVRPVGSGRWANLAYWEQVPLGHCDYFVSHGGTDPSSEHGEVGRSSLSEQPHSSNPLPCVRHSHASPARSAEGTRPGRMVGWSASGRGLCRGKGKYEHGDGLTHVHVTGAESQRTPREHAGKTCAISMTTDHGNCAGRCRSHPHPPGRETGLRPSEGDNRVIARKVSQLRCSQEWGEQLSGWRRDLLNVR